ncbi:hypothetical protein RHSIM_Rhsim07G0049100 [Rhododendron simsii]|uniref:Uncharacterized protein n=1 Tax=Rhododendron simsii TaxID=118357 RepID=A0A834GKB5_RHOSS|nr:hypothetical protein RHSIM_Rhsim07G0049100 [Rhododendron simsii]
MISFLAFVLLFVIPTYKVSRKSIHLAKQMGSEGGNPNKPRYDITMSKRTRKPVNLQTEADQILPKAASLENEVLTKAIKKEEEKSSSEGEESDHKSLQQLIKTRSPLGQHFTEEKQLPLVVKHQEERLKFKGLVSHPFHQKHQLLSGAYNTSILLPQLPSQILKLFAWVFGGGGIMAAAAAFGSSPGTICADFFGDELGLPLPRLPPNKMNAKNVDLVKNKNEDGSKKSTATAGVMTESRKQVALAFTPCFDGVQPFDMLLFH